MRRKPLTTCVVTGVVLACASGDALETLEPRILVFSKTAAFRHASIEDGIEALQRMAAEQGMRLDATEDATVFNPGVLTTYDVIVFLLTTGDVLDEQQQRAFAEFIEGGGGYVGIHSASDTEYDWEWYGRLVGGYFTSHPSNPNVREGTLLVAAADHPATAGLPNPWIRTDEWYDIRDLQTNVTVLLNIDERSYKAADENPAPNPRPIAWSHDVGAGRAFYTALGHTPESYVEPSFLAHVLGGLQFALGND